MQQELNERYELFGWKPCPNLSEDENYLDLVMLLTRNSKCRQGHMGCVIIKSADKSNVDENSMSRSDLELCLYDRIIGASTNLELYRKYDSDIHAEVGALGDASKKGNSTLGSTAYITMAPCKRCFTSLFSSGVKRIVTRQPLPDVMATVAREHGIDYRDMKFQENEQDIRINKITSTIESSQEFRTELTAERKRRAEEKRKRKAKRKQMLSKEKECDKMDLINI